MGARVLAGLLFMATLISGCEERRGPTGQQAVHVVQVGDQRMTLLIAGDEGMRGLTGFAGADGMLFDFDQDVDPGSVVFVMDGVAFPLEIAWFSESGALVGTASMATCAKEPCPTYTADAPYRWAIEAPPGAFAALRPTDRLDIRPEG